ncbi:MAG: hypothetical protein WD851_04025 [Pirellulales bacterium]
MRDQKWQILLCILVVLGPVVAWSSWSLIYGPLPAGYVIGLVAFVPFLFTSSLLLCYLLGLGKGQPGPDN